MPVATTALRSVFTGLIMYMVLLGHRCQVGSRVGDKFVDRRPIAAGEECSCLLSCLLSQPFEDLVMNVICARIKT